MPKLKTKKTARRQPEVHFCACGDHAFAPLTKGFVTLVSPEDSDLLASRLWYAHLGSGGRPYAMAARPNGRRGEKDSLHRTITGAVKEGLVDHRDGNGIDNRRPNLRPATHSQNSANRRKARNPKYDLPVGVSFHKGRGQYQVRCAGRWIGRYDTPEEAARAYNAAAVATHGEFASTHRVAA